MAIVEDCFECPFFVDNEWEVVKKSKCKKLNLEGHQTDLFNVCPLPNYIEPEVEELFYNENKEMGFNKKDGFWSWSKND